MLNWKCVFQIGKNYNWYLEFDVSKDRAKIWVI